MTKLNHYEMTQKDREIDKFKEKIETYRKLLHQ